jgi:hypothetical protein
MHSFSPRWIWACAVALVLGLTSTSFGQGVTTADINGFVTDSDGKAVAGAKVIALHVPSGTQSTAITNSRGQYDIDGLRPGGPYLVSVSSSAGSESQSDIYVDVGSRFRASFMFQSSIVKMEAVKVNTTADDTFDSGAMSLGTSFSSKDVGGVETIRRDVQDLENLDPRANVMQVSPSDSQYTISFAGQNPRENLFLIDGVSATDNFGLNSNGYAGFRNPLPPEWIESITVDLSPYDVVFSGFQGGLLNATLKSGTNQFHGTFYDLYEGTNFRGANPVPSSILGSHEKIQAHTVGGTVSGPIIKDKLFFFVGYDTFRQISVPPVENFVPDNSGGIYTQIINKTISSYGFNPGTFVATNHSWQQNFVGKLDWNISDSQKFEFTFRHTDGEAPNFYNYTSSFETSLSTSWYNTHRTDQSYTVKLISDWSQFIPTLHTEIEGTYKRYNGTAQLNGADAPAITIDNVPGTSLNGGTAPFAVFLGQYWAYQTNNIYTWEQEEHAYADYSIGNHTIKFGVSFDRTGYTDTFIPNTLGSYTFATVQDYLNGTPTYVQQAATYPGYTLSSAVSHYYSLNIAPLIGDTWRVNDSLSIVGGMRLDYPYEPQKPPFSPLFYNAYGYKNNTTNNGNYTFSPRAGFTYLLPFKLKTQIRGGAGLFLGQNPVVWTENSFNNAGQLNTVNAGSTSSAATTPVVPGYTFTGPVPPPVNAAASTAVPAFDVINPKFKAPSNWKENIAIDRELGFWNLIATANIDYSQVNQDAITRDVNLKTAATGPAYMPDGAIHFNGNVTPGSLGAFNLSPLPAGGSTSTSSISSTTLSANPLTGPVYYLTNTTKGAAQEYTLQLRRPMVDGWAFSFAWSHTHSTQVDPGSSSTASGNYGDNPFVNPNDNIAYRSQYATPDKFVLTGAKQFKFFKVKNSMTTISAQYIAQTGQPYSYVFKGDADGSGISGESLFYVPTGPNDPKVTWGSAAEQTAFFQFLQNTPDLAKYAGKIVPRNGSYAPWEHFMNVHVEQQIPIYGTARLVAFWDCFDFGNLLNKNWGTITNYNGSFNTRTVAGTFLNNTTGQYIYTFNTATLGTPTTYPDLSRWTMQIGARLEF